VLLDSTEKVGKGFTGSNRRGKVLLHEIGHAVGLGHVSATNQRMNHIIDQTSTSNWGAGDLRGLNRLGIAGGCVTDRG
jgi:peptidase M66-like protein